MYQIENLGFYFLFFRFLSTCLYRKFSSYSFKLVFIWLLKYKQLMYCLHPLYTHCLYFLSLNTIAGVLIWLLDHCIFHFFISWPMIRGLANDESGYVTII